VDEELIIAMIVLSSTDKEHFDEAYTAFKDLVGSYFFLPKNLNFKR
jgi:hypothetical protein